MATWFVIVFTPAGIRNRIAPGVAVVVLMEQAAVALPPRAYSEAATTGVSSNSKCPGATSPELSPLSVTAPPPDATIVPGPEMFAESASDAVAVM